MRASTRKEIIQDRLRHLGEEDLRHARCELCKVLYLVESELYSRTGRPIADLQPASDKLFYFTLVLVGGFVTWLSIGAWAL
jgi:hypothetical protein